MPSRWLIECDNTLMAMGCILLLGLLAIFGRNIAMEHLRVARIVKMYDKEEFDLVEGELTEDARALVQKGSIHALPILIETNNRRGLMIFRRACEDYGEELLLKGLAELVTHVSPSVRMEATDIIRRVGLHSDVGVRALCRAMHDPDGEIRAAAVEAIGEIGHHARPMAAIIVRILATDPDGVARCAAAHALGRIGADDVSTIAALKAAIVRETRPIRYAAAVSLEQLGVRIVITEHEVRLE